jgi:hypothetical protein
MDTIIGSFWNGVALGVLTYAVVAIAAWVIWVYWQDDARWQE